MKMKFSVDQIYQLIEKLQTNSSHNSIGHFVKIFRLLVKMDEDTNAQQEEDQQQNKQDYIIDDPQVFEKVLKFGFQQFPEILKNYLGITSLRHQLKTKKQQILLKVYLYNLFKFFHQVQDDNMNLFILRYLPEISDLFFIIPLLLNKLINHLLDLWASSDSFEIKLNSFVVIRRISVNGDENLQEKIFRKAYLNYVKNVKIVNWRNYELIIFMNNCFGELLACNFSVAYLVSFSYIRQLSVHLKTQIQEKKEGGEMSLYNWQNINCLRLWVLAVSRYSNMEELGQLIHPLVEIIQGMIIYSIQNIYIPAQLHLIRLLVMLQEKTGILVPIMKYFKQILNCTEFRSKKIKGTQKPFDMQISLKVDKQYKKTNIFWNEVFLEVINLIMQFLSNYSTSISFPEISFSVIKYLRSLRKELRFIYYKMKIKEILGIIEGDVSTVLQRRKEIKFGPKDSKNCQLFKEIQEQTKLHEYCKKIKTERDTLIKQKILAEKEEFYDKKNEENDEIEEESYEFSEQNESEEEKAIEYDLENMDYQGDPTNPQLDDESGEDGEEGTERTPRGQDEDDEEYDND